MVKADIKRREQQSMEEATSAHQHETEQSSRVFVPRADIYEQADALVVIADMPGVNEKTVDINVEKNVLTVRGHVEPPVFEGFREAYREYEIGEYERAFTLSNAVDVNRIEASVKDGVLRIVLPKAEAAKPRKIKVTSG